MTITTEERDFIGEVLKEDAAEREPKPLRKEEAVPPAGDVEVLGYMTRRRDGLCIELRATDFSDKFKKFIEETPWSALRRVELVDRAHVTSLTAERDALQLLLNDRDEGLDIMNRQAGKLCAKIDGLQAEKYALEDQVAGLRDLNAECATAAIQSTWSQ